MQITMRMAQSIAGRPWLSHLVMGSKRTNRSLYLAGWYHAQVSPNLPDWMLVHPGETVCYVGTYRPERVALLADAVGPEGHVVVVEAHPENFAKLQAGLAAMRIPARVTLINKALYKAEGVITFGIYEDLPEHHLVMDHPGQREYGPPQTTIDIPATIFDAVYREYPDIRYVFVTINGAELEAIEGMTGYLSVPGNSTWIKSPFLDKATNRPMTLEVDEQLAAMGMKTFIGRGFRESGGVMGKVFAYRPF